MTKKITRGYKYMDNNDTTLNNTKWGDGVTHEATGSDGELCTKDLIHFYPNKYIAILMDPIHGKYTKNKNYIMRTCVAEGKVITDGIKSGAKKVTTGRKVKPITLSLEQRVECAIRISLLVYSESRYVQWAEKWLSGEDRSYDSARKAACFFARCGVARCALISAYLAADVDILPYLESATREAAEFVAYTTVLAVEAGAEVKEIIKIVKSVLKKDNEK